MRPQSLNFSNARQHTQPRRPRNPRPARLARLRPAVCRGNFLRCLRQLRCRAEQSGGPRIALAGHADEIAMAVNCIDDNGYIYVRRVGGIDAAIMKAQRVTIHTRSGPVKGVVGNVAPHLTKQEGDPKPPKIHEIFVDIGVSSRGTRRSSCAGDPMTLVDEFDILRGDLAVARAFDNRIGTFAVIEALRVVEGIQGEVERGDLRRLKRAGGEGAARRTADRLFA